MNHLPAEWRGSGGHVPRRFFELAASGPAPIASEVLERIAALHPIEATIRGRSPDERQHARQQRSRPILDALATFLREKLALISQKTKLAEAIRYALSRWQGLCRFAGDGQVEIDNNTGERSIRPLAPTRKNALFAGSDGGARHWAVVASLVETCKPNGLDPLAYLADVITRIVNAHPNRHSDDLMPWRFQPPRQQPRRRGMTTALTYDREQACLFAKLEPWKDKVTVTHGSRTDLPPIDLAVSTDLTNLSQNSVAKF